MEELRPDQLVAQVVAWHNRHPLARRITAAQVHSVGWVLLPFVQPAGAASATRIEPAGLPQTLPAPTPVAHDHAAHELEPALVSAVLPGTSGPAAPPTELETTAKAAAGQGAVPAVPALPEASTPGAASEPESPAAHAADAATEQAPAADTDIADALEGLDELEGLEESAAAQAAEAADAPEPAEAPEIKAPAEPAAAPLDAPTSLRQRLVHRAELSPADQAADLGSAVFSAAALPAAAAAMEGHATRGVNGASADPAVGAAAARPPPAIQALTALTALTARSRRQLLAVFSEPFFEHAKPRQVARWARRHGSLISSAGLPPAPQLPLREVLRDTRLLAAAPGGAAAAVPVDLLLKTAAIEWGDQRLRLLMSLDERPAVLGPRLWSRPRLALALSLPLLLGSLGLNAALLGLAPRQPSPALAQAQGADADTTKPASQSPDAAAAAETRAAAHAESAASSAPAGQGPAALTPHEQNTPAPAATATPVQLAQAAPPLPHDAHAPAKASPDSPSPSLMAAPANALLGASPASPLVPDRAAVEAGAGVPAANASDPAAVPGRPLDVEPQLGQFLLPLLGPLERDPQMAVARQRRDALRASQQKPDQRPAANQAKAGTPAPASPTAPPAAAATEATPRPVSTQPAYGLSTRLLRTQSESEQLAQAMRVLLQAMQPGAALRVERVQVGGDWQVLGGPFASAASAEAARALLQSRGVRTTVVGSEPAAAVRR